jgi:hypothetical protein
MSVIEPPRPSDSVANVSASLASSPVVFLMVMNFLNFLGFASWSALLNNFARDAAGFTGADIGLLQSVREIPGLLSFTAVWWLLLLREQTLAYASLFIMGIGVAITGYYPSVPGLLATTLLMSVGFHYMETMNQSLSLQLLPKLDAPRLMGRIAGAGAIAQLLAYGGMALTWRTLQPGYAPLYVLTGTACALFTIVAALAFRRFDGTVVQRKHLFMRRRYWLYYALTFMSGARRQIFIAFASFLMVERFGYDVTAIALLFLITCSVNTLAAPWLGGLVGRLGERLTIMIENVSLIVVFLGYAVAALGWLGEWGGSIAAVFYIIDGIFITLVIAQRTYFQKIADPADMAPTAGVAFAINHIAAVVIPVTFGLIWLESAPLVFVIGAGIAGLSLALSFLIPRHPAPGRETLLSPGS